MDVTTGKGSKGANSKTEIMQILKETDLDRYDFIEQCNFFDGIRFYGFFNLPSFEWKPIETTVAIWRIKWKQ